MTIIVMQEDIDNGERGVAEQCPVALALKRSTGKRAHVNACFLNVGCKCYDTPFSASEFIVAFDCGKRVEPIAFELPIP